MNSTFVQELFKERELRPFEASQQELEIGKQSLIFKKKCNTNIHSLLFCKVFSSAQSEITTQNQKKIFEEEKQKYFDYVRKTFKEKIPEDFESENKLKKTLKTKIAQKKENEAAKNQQEGFKRPRVQVESSKSKNTKQNEQTGNKKHKKVEQISEKKEIGEQEGSNEVFEDQEFESEVSLGNDQVEQNFYADDYGQA